MIQQDSLNKTSASITTQVLHPPIKRVLAREDPKPHLKTQLIWGL